MYNVMITRTLPGGVPGIPRQGGGGGGASEGAKGPSPNEQSERRGGGGPSPTVGKCLRSYDFMHTFGKFEKSS